MKNKLLSVWMLALAIAMLLILQSPTQALGQTDAKEVLIPTERIDLWNGEDFTGWDFFLDPEKQAKASEVWRIQDGVIHCIGVPNGYMKTESAYANYKLHVEWRWPQEPGNSGVFLHMREPDGLWPKSLEAQLWTTRAGDFVAFADVNFEERVDMSSRVIEKMEDSAEKEAGMWNSYDIICNGNNVTVYVNGVLMNQATGANINAGKICLQSEGKPIQFRNVYIEPLTE